MSVNPVDSQPDTFVDPSERRVMSPLKQEVLKGNVQALRSLLQAETDPAAIRTFVKAHRPPNYSEMKTSIREQIPALARKTSQRHIQAQLLSYGSTRSAEAVFEGRDTPPEFVTSQLVAHSMARSMRKMVEQFADLLPTGSGETLAESLEFASNSQSYSDQDIAHRIRQGLPTFILGDLSKDSSTVLIWRDHFIAARASACGHLMCRFDQTQLTTGIIHELRTGACTEAHAQALRFHKRDSDKTLDLLIRFLFDTQNGGASALINWQARSFENALRLYFLLDRYFILPEIEFPQQEHEIRAFFTDTMVLCSKVNGAFTFCSLFHTAELVRKYAAHESPERLLLCKAVCSLFRTKVGEVHFPSSFAAYILALTEDIQLKVREKEVVSRLVDAFKHKLSTIPDHKELLEELEKAERVQFDFASGTVCFVDPSGNAIIHRVLDEEELFALFTPERETAAVQSIAKRWSQLPRSISAVIPSQHFMELFHTSVYFRGSALITKLYSKHSILFLCPILSAPGKWFIKFAPDVDREGIEDRLQGFAKEFENLRSLVYAMDRKVAGEEPVEDSAILDLMAQSGGMSMSLLIDAAELFSPRVKKHLHSLVI